MLCLCERASLEDGFDSRVLWIQGKLVEGFAIWLAALLVESFEVALVATLPHSILCDVVFNIASTVRASALEIPIPFAVDATIRALALDLQLVLRSFVELHKGWLVGAFSRAVVPFAITTAQWIACVLVGAIATCLLAASFAAA